MMQRKETPTFLSVVIVILILFTVPNSDAAALIANGGACLTYDDTLPGTLLTFEPCNSWNPKHKSWEVVFGEDSANPGFLFCIVGTEMCTQIAADGKAYLIKKDLTDPTQVGVPSDDWPERFTNNQFGPNFCFQAMYNEDDDDDRWVPDYLQVQRCSTNPNQIMLGYVPDEPAARSFANYFRYAFFRDYSGAYNVVPHRFPIISPPRPFPYYARLF